MFRKIYIEAGAEKFALFKTASGLFFLRAPKVAYHNYIKDAFEREVSGLTTYQPVDWGGAKFYEDKETVTLHDFSAAWGYFPAHLKEHLIPLFQEAFPGKTIVDRLD